MSVEMHGMSAIGQLANDLARAPARTANEARGSAAKALDAAAEEARRNALASWTAYGRGMEGSAGTIRARMSRSEKTVGYLFGDGPGVYMSEYGSGARAPQPVMQEAVRNQVDGWTSELGNIVGRL